MTQYVLIGIVACVVIATVLLCIAIFKYRSSMLLLLAIVLALVGAGLFAYTLYGIVVPTVDEIMLSAYQSDFSDLKNNSDKLNGNDEITESTNESESSTNDGSQDTLINNDLEPQDTSESESTNSNDAGTPTNLEDFLNSVNNNITVSTDSPFVEFPNNTDMLVSYTVCDSNGNTVCWSDTTSEPGTPVSLDFTDAINAGITDISISAIYKNADGETGNTVAETLSATLTIE